MMDDFNTEGLIGAAIENSTTTFEETDEKISIKIKFEKNLVEEKDANAAAEFAKEHRESILTEMWSFIYTLMISAIRTMNINKPMEVTLTDENWKKYKITVQPE